MERAKAFSIKWRRSSLLVALSTPPWTAEVVRDRRKMMLLQDELAVAFGGGAGRRRRMPVREQVGGQVVPDLLASTDMVGVERRFWDLIFCMGMSPGRRATRSTAPPRVRGFFFDS